MPKIKTILYIATTINGYVAKENDTTSFVSDVEWRSFLVMVKRTGNMIIGRRTYEVMRRAGELKALDPVTIMVVTSQAKYKVIGPNNYAVRTPIKALDYLKKLGFKEALVAGGGILNSSFITKKLIDEIYLVIEPVAFGKGIKLFADKPFDFNLQLLDFKRLSPDEIQLHYKVIK
ncbi:MAG: dihydrofolate reductase family protein [Patescibacteria group bacterium]|nr:dihydrofolate reductase family protein [Patescibacteria group bacterium]